uniref:Uncharacterized protein n=1 Tax=Globisporangium ultimum (strain ATCC 200006 / CBS 805.95 / DAOM BR144) TaxID=431595 RepID=K3X578_GLOUD
MNGTANVLLVNRRSTNRLIKLAVISLVIKLKKQVEPSHRAQAFSQLVGCCLKAPLHCYPLSLLADLNNVWHFSWFNEAHMVAEMTLRHPKNAFVFIEAAVAEREGSIPFHVLFTPRLLKKLKLGDFVFQSDDGADEQMEKWELMADELDPEFLQARRAEYAAHLVRPMPMYARTFE